MVNYFGKARQVDDITVSPVLLRKGATHVAVYGLGNVRDERLHRTFRNGRVHFATPSTNEHSFFNMFVIHQNRYGLFFEHV